MKMKISKGFRNNQRGTIRAALSVAACNFPMPPTVTVERIPRGFAVDPKTGQHTVDGFIWDDNPRTIYLAPYLRDALLFFTVSHEARHVSDHYTGKIQIRETGDFYNGKRINYRLAYRNLPHEKPALAYERKLGYNRIKK